MHCISEFIRDKLSCTLKNCISGCDISRKSHLRIICILRWNNSLIVITPTKDIAVCIDCIWILLCTLFWIRACTCSRNINNSWAVNRFSNCTFGTVTKIIRSCRSINSYCVLLYIEFSLWTVAKSTLNTCTPCIYMTITCKSQAVISACCYLDYICQCTRTCCSIFTFQYLYRNCSIWRLATVTWLTVWVITPRPNCSVWTKCNSVVFTYCNHRHNVTSVITCRNNIKFNCTCIASWILCNKICYASLLLNIQFTCCVISAVWISLKLCHFSI